MIQKFFNTAFRKILTSTIFGLLMLLTVNASPYQEVRNLDNFNSISLSIPAKVYIQQGSSFRVAIDADENDLDKIETEVRNGKLDIKNKNWSSNIKGSVVINITMPELTALSVAGSGSFTTSSVFKCNDLNLSVTGSGNIKMEELSAEKLDALITGSGNISLNGNKTAGELKLNITGSGSYSAPDLKTDKVMITITGSGSAKINAVKELDTNITGSGDVHYKGDPIVNAHSTGSGKTRKM